MLEKQALSIYHVLYRVNNPVLRQGSQLTKDNELDS